MYKNIYEHLIAGEMYVFEIYHQKRGFWREKLSENPADDQLDASP